MAQPATAPPLTVTGHSVSENLLTHLPAWLGFSGEVRERFEGFGGSGFKAHSTDDYDLHRLRLGILIKPAWWLKFFGQMQDARVWGRQPAIPPYQNTWDLRQAYVELGSTVDNGAGLRVGRQDLNFGNGRMIGESSWTNVARTFDAIRASFRRGKYRVDAFAASVVIARDGVIDHHNQSNNLHGVYAAFEDLVPNSVLQPYTLWRLQRGVGTEEGTPGHLDQHTYGLRWIGKLPADLDYRIDVAVQRGTLGTESIRAWSGHWVGGYTLAGVRTKPRLFLEYDYASGDKAAKDGATNTFDPLYPSAHDKMGLADQFGERNLQDLRAGAEFKPGKKSTATTSFHDFWLSSARDGLYSTRGIIARSPQGTAGTHVGEELDGQVVYKPTPQTQTGFGCGRIFTGEFLNKTTGGKDYNFAYLLFGYVF